MIRIVSIFAILFFSSISTVLAQGDMCGTSLPNKGAGLSRSLAFAPEDACDLVTRHNQSQNYDSDIQKIAGSDPDMVECVNNLVISASSAIHQGDSSVFGNTRIFVKCISLVPAFRAMIDATLAASESPVSAEEPKIRGGQCPR